MNEHQVILENAVHGKNEMFIVGYCCDFDFMCILGHAFVISANYVVCCTYIVNVLRKMDLSCPTLVDISL